VVIILDDNSIIDLYFARDEQAIEETRINYGRLIYAVAYDILRDDPDSEECESDTYVRTWNAVPPTRPQFFSSFLCKITRNIALNRARDGKRRLNVELVFDEISDAIPDNEGDLTEEIILRDALNDFLEGLGNTKRQIFLKRYFFMRDIKDIAREMGIAVTSVKVSLSRTRRELRQFLEKRGIVI
jgi:RNA polymerase sigma-70 factor (ECF subfamily)